jgi:ABC-type enterobactin transport system permease subunit
MSLGRTGSARAGSVRSARLFLLLAALGTGATVAIAGAVAAEAATIAAAGPDSAGAAAGSRA